MEIDAALRNVISITFKIGLYLLALHLFEFSWVALNSQHFVNIAP